MPRKQILWLGIIFIILPAALYLLKVIRAAGDGGSEGIFFVFLWHVLLSLVYIMSYPAVQAECPTLKIVLSVADSMPNGMTIEDVGDIFSEDALLNERVEDLIRDGLIFLNEDKCVLSCKGYLLAAFFSGYRGLLGLPAGEG